MNYQKYNMNSYRLHFLKTSKFKKITILVNFKRILNKKNVTIRSFLPHLLLHATKKFPTRRLLNIEAEKLYDLDLVYNIRRIGNYSVLSFFLGVNNEKYTEKGMFKKQLELLFDVLFNPNVLNNKFDSNIFKVERNRFISHLKSYEDNHEEYSVIRMLEEMDKDSPISYRKGYINDIDKITEESLYKYYQSVINSDDIDIFILGDIDIKETKNIFKEKFLVNTIKRSLKPIIIKHNNYRKRVKKVIESKDIKQAKLVLGLKLINLTEHERKNIIPIYNSLLGGGMYSKLHKVVREKHSLTYYIYSSYFMGDNLLIIESVINKENFNKTLSLIKKEIDNIAKGNINNEEFNNTIKHIQNTIRTQQDSTERTINYYMLRDLLDLDEIAVKETNLKKVSVIELKKVSKKIKLDTIFLLCGDEKNGKENN